jgi:hypothetical protein
MFFSYFNLHVQNLFREFRQPGEARRSFHH